MDMASCVASSLRYCQLHHKHAWIIRLIILVGMLRPRSMQSFLKRKVAESVAKQIKSQLEHAGVTDLPK